MTAGLFITLFVLATCPYAAPLALIAVCWAEYDRRQLERWKERQRLAQLARRLKS